MSVEKTYILNDDQVKVLEKITYENNLILNLPCGFGKRIVLRQHLLNISQKIDINNFTVVITSRKLFVLHMWMSLLQFLNPILCKDETSFIPVNGKITIYLVMINKLPINVSCDMFILDNPQSYKSLDIRTIISGNVIVSSSHSITSQDRRILDRCFGCKMKEYTIFDICHETRIFLPPRKEYDQELYSNISDCLS